MPVRSEPKFPPPGSDVICATVPASVRARLSDWAASACLGELQRPKVWWEMECSQHVRRQRTDRWSDPSSVWIRNVSLPLLFSPKWCTFVQYKCFMFLTNTKTYLYNSINTTVLINWVEDYHLRFILIINCKVLLKEQEVCALMTSASVCESDFVTRIIIYLPTSLKCGGIHKLLKYFYS